MMFYRLVATLVPLALSLGPATALQHLPPRVSGTIQPLGHTKDAAFASDGNFRSDGGAGGKVGGYNLITLSDARTILPGGTESYPVHTVYAYFGVRDPMNSTEITIVGNYTKKPPFYYLGGDNSGAGVIIADPSDPYQRECFGPAPNTAMVRIPGNDTGGITVWNVDNACKSGPKYTYTTLIEFDVQDPDTLNKRGQNIPAQRTVLALHNSQTEPLYGVDGLSTDGKYYYLLALDNNVGYKMARVLVGDRTHKNKYQYWYPNEKVWNSTVHTLNDTSTNFYTPPPVGGNSIFGSDFFYSPYFQTWVLTGSPADGFGAKYFDVAYSTSGDPVGPFKHVGQLYKPAADPDCATLNIKASSGTYLIHAHPGWDESGKTLLIGWISCNTFTNMALLTWAD